jgi:murein DD-endopeptidase MepM/ murein hydrolase activator NlpD
MLIKTASFNQLRQERDTSRVHNAKLEKALEVERVQTASLGSLASEVSALYGLTASKLSLPAGRVKAAGKEATKSIAVSTAAPLTDDSYYKSVDTFYALRTTAMSGVALRPLPGGPDSLNGFDHLSGFGDLSVSLDAPSLWPVMGPITSAFGEREDPILGNGEGEFHTGVDIGAVNGTPVRATADGTVISAAMENGYGREITIDHGHGLKTLYGHLSGFNCMPGQQVLRGQVIGYVGHSGRTTGAHLHYEVRIQNTPVNPHKYLQVTLAELGGISSGL